MASPPLAASANDLPVALPPGLALAARALLFRGEAELLLPEKLSYEAELPPGELADEAGRAIELPQSEVRSIMAVADCIKQNGSFTVSGAVWA